MTFQFQGVIFGIDYQETHERICTTSDDRSIIMYGVTFSSASSTKSDEIQVQWANASIEPLLHVFGHSGRVWKVVLMTNVFVSIGEV